MEPSGAAASPATATATATSVPESARFCPRCDGPVGRGRAGRPGRERGTCPWCGALFDLRPELPAGTELAGRYRVTRPLARGGRGWLYLGTDRTDGVTVVLSRLEGPEGPAAGALAVGETAVLLELAVPGLVRARDVVTTPRGVRMLVLEHVEGVSLAERRPLDVVPALDAVGGAVPALTALHARGLLHTDLNPANLLVGPDGGITVLDLGSVRRLEDRESDVWATSGFVAPEIRPGGPGPSVASEVFALGRTLAVLVAEFDHLRTHAYTLPDPAGFPVLRAHPELLALLRRATDADPAARHRSVESFADEVRTVRARIATQGPAGSRPGDPGVGRREAADRAYEDGPLVPRAARRARDGVGASTP